MNDLALVLSLLMAMLMYEYLGLSSLSVPEITRHNRSNRSRSSGLHFLSSNRLLAEKVKYRWVMLYNSIAVGLSSCELVSEFSRSLCASLSTLPF